MHQHGYLAALLAVSLIQLMGCSWSDQASADFGGGPVRIRAGTGHDAVRLQVADTASNMVGAPYRYGGRTPDGFDCSGLVYFSYAQAGISVPRTSREQMRATTPIELADARPGDLLFFRQRQKVSHVAIYLGDDRFVHAPSTGKRVSIDNMSNPYYRRQFVRAGRLSTGS